MLSSSFRFAFIALAIVLSGCASSREERQEESQTEAKARDMPPLEWKSVSFREATCNTLYPLQLEFSIPADYIIKDTGDVMVGTIWGTKADVARLESKKEEEINKVENAYFIISVSMRNAYFIERDKFSLEDGEAEARRAIKNLQCKRLDIGGYPALAVTGESANGGVYSCLIATLNETNVINIRLFTPKKLTGRESEIFNGFLSKIKRPEYKQAKFDGEDAKPIIDKLVEGIRAGEGRSSKMTASLAIGEESASKKASIRESIEFIGGGDSFKGTKTSFEIESHELIEKRNGANNRQFFSSPPWNIDKQSYEVRNEAGKLVLAMEVEGKTERRPIGDINLYNMKDASELRILFGYPVMPACPLHAFVSRILGLYDFKMTERKDGLATLKGVPSKARLASIMSKGGIPLNTKGLDMVSEISKRIAVATVVVSESDWALRSFSIEGRLDENRCAFSLLIERKSLCEAQ